MMKQITHNYSLSIILFNLYQRDYLKFIYIHIQVCFFLVFDIVQVIITIFNLWNVFNFITS
jgi:hypothetical protein